MGEATGGDMLSVAYLEGELPRHKYNLIRLAAAVKNCADAPGNLGLAEAAEELGQAIRDVLSDLAERDHD